jgi:hypothetical protein
MRGGGLVEVGDARLGERAVKVVVHGGPFSTRVEGRA